MDYPFKRIAILVAATLAIPAALSAQTADKAKSTVNTGSLTAPVAAGSLSSGKPSAGSMSMSKPSAGSLSSGKPSAGSLSSGKPSAGSLSSGVGAGSIAAPVGRPYNATRAQRLESKDDSSTRTRSSRTRSTRNK